MGENARKYLEANYDRAKIANEFMRELENGICKDCLKN
jgi:hypothetical protein